VTLTALQPRLISSQTELRLGPTDVGVAITAAARFENPGDGETHLQAFLTGGNGALELLDTTGTATVDHAVELRIRFSPAAPGGVSAVLHVQHDGQPDDQGSRQLVVQILGTANPLPDCDDHNPCTADMQDVASPNGCTFIAIRGACDDADLCTRDDTCMAGRCVGRVLDCDDGVECTADTCEPESGKCLNSKVSQRCNDADPCSLDFCEPLRATNVSGCWHATAENGTLCGAAACGALPLCIAGVCTTSLAPDGYPCDDGNACSTSDTCRAGVCVAEAGNGSWLSTPVLLRDGPADSAPLTQDDAGVTQVPVQRLSPIRGDWPVYPDAVLPFYPLDPVFEPSSSFFLWRGRALGAGPCGEMGCRDAPQCGSGPYLGLSLHASRADLNGRIISDVTLSQNAAYARIASEVYPGFDAQDAPHGSVAAAAGTVLYNGDIYGAAIIAYSGQCACGGTPPSSSSSTTGGGAPLPSCLPPGDALVVFRVDDSGLHVTDHVWLGPQSIYEVYSVVTAFGPEHRRLVDITAHETGFAVTYVTLDLIQDCLPCDGCECPTLYTLNALLYRQTPAGFVRSGTTEARHALPDGVTPRAIRARSVQQSLMATLLTTQVEDVPVECDGLVPLTLGPVTVMNLQASGVGPQAQTLPAAADAVVGMVDGMPHNLVFWRRVTSSAMHCVYDERLYVSNPVELQDVSWATASSMLATDLAAVDIVDGRGLVATINGNGTLAVGVAAPGPLHMLGVMDVPSSMGGVDRAVGMRMGTLGGAPTLLMVVAQVFPGSGNRETGLVMTRAACGTTP